VKFMFPERADILKITPITEGTLSWFILRGRFDLIDDFIYLRQEFFLVTRGAG